MPFKIAYESDFYKIEVDIDKNLLQAKWLRHVSEEEMIAGGTQLYEVLRSTKIERAVANAQALGSFNSSTKDWMATTFYELLSQTNLKKIARVLPSIVFHQIALESVVTRAEAMGKTRFEVKNFSDHAKALDWLLT